MVGGRHHCGGTVTARRRYRERTWVDPRQEFQVSPTQGVGSFARAPIRKGEVLEVVGGDLMDEEEFRAFVWETPRFNAIQVDESLHLVERSEVTKRRAGGSLNHSCDSNLWMADEVTLVARRDDVRVDVIGSTTFGTGAVSLTYRPSSG